MLFRLRFLLLLACGQPILSIAQNLAPNPSFESGSGIPSSWTQVYGNGTWEDYGRSGNHCVSLWGSDCGNLWRTTECPVQSSNLYVARVWMNSKALQRLQAFFGWDPVKRYVSVDESWREFQLYAVMPANLSSPRLSIGQCRSGKISADDISVYPAAALQRLSDGYPLGFGESLAGGKYAYRSLFSNATAVGPYSEGNYAPCLYSHTALFDTWYWDLRPGAYIIYRHGLPGLWLTNASVSLTSYYSSAPCQVIMEVSTDCTNWVEGARLPLPGGSASRSFQTNMPLSVFPATNIFLRLTSTANVQIHKYGFEATAPDNQVTAEGKTWFLELEQPIVDTRLHGMMETATGWVCRVEFGNPYSVPRQLSVSAIQAGPAGMRTNALGVTIPGLSSQALDLLLPPAGAGENLARIKAEDVANGTVLLNGSLPVTVAALQDQHFGYGLPSPQGVELWWCENMHKVSRLPRDNEVTSQAVEISAARNESESFQVVLRAANGLTNARVLISELIMDGEGSPSSIAATNVETCLVEYVPVRLASDYSGTPGEHPDPLIPITNTFSIAPGLSQPIWVTVCVPKNAPAGWYNGSLRVECENLEPFTVPIRMRVYGFSLSDMTHTKTVYKLWLDDDWHKLTTVDQKRTVWDMYMDNLRRHRLSSPHPHQYAPITWTLAGENFTLNTADFDAAMSRYLDEFGFNGFSLLYRPDFLGGYWRNTAEYRRLMSKLIAQIMEHLRGKGWDKQAYVWWYDEPNPSIYDQLRADMKAIQDGAPDLRRMTTYQPDPPIFGYIDVWTPLMTPFRWSISDVLSRQSLGEEMWWYVASWPAYPCANNYIDQPGINQRIRSWMAERYDVRGDLYWSTVWYKTTNGVTRNPWTDPMCIGGVGNAALGNGEGLLHYPPVRTLPTGPVISGPIDSLRLKLIREGLEDGEYFWTLKNVLRRNFEKRGLSDPAVVEGFAARDQALGLVSAMDHFEQSPRRLMGVRNRIGIAIEALEDGAPFIVSQPVSKIAQAGGKTQLRMEAVGWPVPTYRWYRDGIPLDGETNSIVEFANVSTGDAGTYKVLVANASGNVFSDEVSLVVKSDAAMPPRILTGPDSIERRIGEKAVLAVLAAGSPAPGYSWTSNDIPIPGATNSTLLFTNVSTGHFAGYKVIVTNVSGAVTSGVARILSVDAPALTICRTESGALLRFSAPNRAVALFSSTNLIEWQEWARLPRWVDPEAVSDVIDDPATKFYRVRAD